MTMRVKLSKGFRFGFTGTPSTGPCRTPTATSGRCRRRSGRYLSYTASEGIKDGANLGGALIEKRLPFMWRRNRSGVGFERVRRDELSDGGQDLIQRQRANVEGVAGHPDRIEIGVDKLLNPLLEHPTSGSGATRGGGSEGVRVTARLDAKLLGASAPSGWIHHLQRQKRRISAFELRMRGRVDRTVHR